MMSVVFSSRELVGAAAETNDGAEVVADLHARRTGVDHLNLAEFPLAAFSKRRAPGEKTLEFGDEVFDEVAGRRIQRRLVISASDRFGLPTPADSDVLLLLIHCTNHRSAFAERVVHFSRYELVERLGWDHGGSSYRRIDESLQRWAGVTLYYNSAWWDRAVRRWRSKTFHVLESIELRGRGDASDDALSSVSWNEVLFASFRESNLKSLDLDFYFALKRAAARQAFRYLDKRFYNERRLEFDLRVFACEHVGLSREHDSSQLKRALEPILGELEDAGYLERASAKSRYIRRFHGQWSIVLQRVDANAERGIDSGGLADELTSRGVWEDVARGLAGSIPAEVVHEYVALHDYLLARKDKRMTNPPAFLASCISKRLPFPRDFLESREKESHPPSKLVKVTRSERKVEVEVDPYAEERKELARLSQEERGALESRALGTATRFMKETYRRTKAKGGPLFDQIREKLLLDEIRRTGVSKPQR